MKTIGEIRAELEKMKPRSAWGRGVVAYALELVEWQEPDAEFYGSPADRKELLYGADSWEQYSEGGCALICNRDIAERLCSPSEFKRADYGGRNPNRRENWIECQTRALHQAEMLILRIVRR